MIKPPAFGLNGVLLLTGAILRRARRWYEGLLELLAAGDCNSITRRSNAHYAMIAAVAPMPKKPGKRV